MNLHDEWDEKFDRRFDRLEKNAGRVFGAALVASIVWMLIIAAFMITAILIGWHYLKGM